MSVKPLLQSGIIQWSGSALRYWIVVAIITTLSLVFLLTLPIYISPYIVVLMSSILMYIVLSVSWTAFCGASQYYSLGIAAFFGVGVYTTAILSEVYPATPLPVFMLAGGFFSACLSLLVGLTTLRIRGMYFAIFTFGLSELLRHFVMWWEVNITGTVGRWIPIQENTIVYRYMTILTVVTILGAFILQKTRYGLALRSIGDAETAAEHIGINVNMVKILVFAGSCFVTGAAGALIATRWTYIDADFAFDPIRNMFAIMMSLFGGMSVLYGPILGAVSLGVVSDVILARFPQISRLLLGLILVGVVIFIPQGLAGLLERLRRYGWKDRLLPKKRIVGRDS